MVHVEVKRIVIRQVMFFKTTVGEVAADRADNGAQTGTAMIMPKTPQKPPPIRIEMMIRKLDTPVVSPRIFGPKKFPSNCCRRTTKIQEIQCLQRVDQKDQQKTRNGAEERAEKRNDIRHTDDYADQQCVRGADQARHKIADGTDDDRIDDFSNEESAEFWFTYWQSRITAFP